MVILKHNEDTTFPNTLPILPQNYNFELRKTLKTITKLTAKRVTLQFPDGLLKYSLPIIDAIKYYTGADCILVNDVVYGACCVEDVKSDLLVHYGHSCLVPISEMEVRVLYVFVDIRLDVGHLYKLMQRFTGRVALIGTIQFNSSVSRLSRLINSTQCNHSKASNIECKSNDHKTEPLEQSGCPDCVTCYIPQVKPLSPGEVIGCTSPKISAKTVIYIGDGRFHLESAMINNPTLDFYKYCPFTKKLSHEFYDFVKLKETREAEIKKFWSSKNVAIILGSLGRQGNKQILANLSKRLSGYKIYYVILDEINENALDRLAFIDGFVQISCPRLSIDWGSMYKKPLLSPFEVYYTGEYTMDYYSKEGSAPWKNYNNTQLG